METDITFHIHHGGEFFDDNDVKHYKRVKMTRIIKKRVETVVRLERVVRVERAEKTTILKIILESY